MAWSAREIAGLVAGIAAVVAVVAGVSDWRERRRRNLDRVSLVDWRTVQLLALATAIVAAALALH